MPQAAIMDRSPHRPPCKRHRPDSHCAIAVGRFELISNIPDGVSESRFSEKKSMRCNEIMHFATNLEHIGDIISVDMIDSILRKKLVNQEAAYAVIVKIKPTLKLDGRTRSVLKKRQITIQVICR